MAKLGSGSQPATQRAELAPAGCAPPGARRLDTARRLRHQGGVAEIYLFTWNLNKDRAAHDLTVKHLAQRGARDLFVACVQELPGRSDLAKARTGKDVAALTAQGLQVVYILTQCSRSEGPHRARTRAVSCDCPSSPPPAAGRRFRRGR
jgi:hypothetical protein